MGEKKLLQRATKRNRNEIEGYGLKRRVRNFKTANYPFSLSPPECFISLTRLALGDATAKEAPCLVDGLFCLVVGPAVFTKAPTLVGSCSTERFEQFR
jgi:hypothetical protein